jgi:hypothetical protein
MVQSDSIAKALYEQFGRVKMPNSKLTDDEITALLAFLDQSKAAS